jgi:16S rRNA (cytosine1402-N4)-methyltransferase
MHVPVLLDEMYEALSIKEGGLYVDATFGGGGYTRKILEQHDDVAVLAFDCDPEAKIRAEILKAHYRDRFFFINDSFANLEKVTNVTHGNFSQRKISGIVYDLGFSSFQLDECTRGFSFRFCGPLDMRMSKEGISAYDVVNSFSEEDLYKIIKEYGEEPKAYYIAKEIVCQRKINPIKTTIDLKNIIYDAKKIKQRSNISRIDPATLTFQALRVFINNELINLKNSLDKLDSYLIDGGHVVIVTFQGLEDRVVKDWYTSKRNLYRLLYQKKTSQSEKAINPKSRSAQLKVFQKNKN